MYHFYISEHKYDYVNRHFEILYKAYIGEEMFICLVGVVCDYEDLIFYDYRISEPWFGVEERRNFEECIANDLTHERLMEDLGLNIS